MARKPARKQRIEPRFEEDKASSLDLRPDHRDRAAAPPAKRSRKKPAKSKPKSTRPSKSARAKQGGRGRGGGSGRRPRKTAAKRSGSWLGWLARRGLYWGFVLGIWGGIFAIGILAYYAAFLPPTSEW